MFIGWVSTIRFYSKSSDYFLIFKTLSKSAPHIQHALFGVAPIYIGFALVGTVLFWRSERFRDTQESFASMLPMFWGSNFYDNFNQVIGCASVFGQLFILGFGIFFGFIVINLFIAAVINQYNEDIN